MLYFFVLRFVFFIRYSLIECILKFKEYLFDLFWVLLVRIKVVFVVRAVFLFRFDLDVWIDWGRDEGFFVDLVLLVSL